MIFGIPERFKDCSFENFVVDELNYPAYLSCKNYNNKDSLLLTGKCDTGKTHLAISVLKEFKLDIENSKVKKEIEEIDNFIRKIKGTKDEWEEQVILGEIVKVSRIEKLEMEKKIIRNNAIIKPRLLFTSMLKVFEELKGFFGSKGDSGEVLRKYCEKRDVFDEEDYRFDCICFDDLGVERLSEWQKEILYVIINSRYENCCPTIFTTNLGISELARKLEDRIVSRLLGMCQVVEVKSNYLGRLR